MNGNFSQLQFERDFIDWMRKTKQLDDITVQALEIKFLLNYENNFSNINNNNHG